MGRLLKVNGVIGERGFVVNEGRRAWEMFEEQSRLRAYRLCGSVKNGSLGPASGWSEVLD